jgi:hypothetical protein
MSRFERIIQKLCSDDPVKSGMKLIHRRWRKIRNYFRRRHWEGFDDDSVAQAIPEDYSADRAEHLWPGAIDRSWQMWAAERWPDDYHQASNIANATAAGRFDLLGSGEISLLDNQGKIRWHDDFKANARWDPNRLYLDIPICLEAEGTDIKVPWELSRFQHIFACLWSDPERYSNIFMSQWEEWLSANPTARGVNWACTMDVALRAITWTAAWAAWGKSWSPAQRRRMAAALAVHGQFIRDNLEWVPNQRTNHYFSDIVGLSVISAVLPGYSPAKKWAAFAHRELRKEILSQFGTDGMIREGSTTYHRLMLELAFLGVKADRLSRYELDEPCRQRLIQACQVILMLCDSKGCVPMIWDNDSSRVFPVTHRRDEEMGHLPMIGSILLQEPSLAKGVLSPEAILLCGYSLIKMKVEAPYDDFPETALLPQSGFFRLGNRKNFLTIRCGPLGGRPTGGHQHLDQLSFTLTVDDQPIVVDPGQYCYTAYPEWRNKFRHTMAHNTVVVDGQTQCRVYSHTKMMYSIIQEDHPHVDIDVFCNNPEQGIFSGSHLGYCRLQGGGRHRRKIEFDGDKMVWRIQDCLELKGRHLVEWYFHLAGNVDIEKVDKEDHFWQLKKNGTTVVLKWISSDFPEGKLNEGWLAPAYGVKISSKVLIFRREYEGRVDQLFEWNVIR